MKRLIFSEDIFHTLAQLEDKDAGQMAKAIACYAHDGTLPKWSNTILMALFSLFRKQIDMQTDSEEKRRIVNKENAKGRNKQKPNNPDETAETGYLRQFLTARPWERKSCTPD